MIFNSWSMVLHKIQGRADPIDLSYDTNVGINVD